MTFNKKIYVIFALICGLKMFSVQANEVVETEAESEPTQEQTANETLEAELDMLYNTNQIGSCTPYPECKDN